MAKAAGFLYLVEIACDMSLVKQLLANIRSIGRGEDRDGCGVLRLEAVFPLISFSMHDSSKRAPVDAVFDPSSVFDVIAPEWRAAVTRSHTDNINGV